MHKRRNNKLVIYQLTSLLFADMRRDQVHTGVAGCRETGRSQVVCAGGSLLVMEESDTGEAHDHIVCVTGGNDVVVADGAAGLCNIFHAGFKGTFNVVAEGEEGVATKRYPGIAP